ncbi:MAG: alpha/beta hydrolase-fold protein [Acidobacteriota bacterium]|nr:alpha/beta hydrolase-fold protein [Acidobacteriota bacterium]
MKYYFKSFSKELKPILIIFIFLSVVFPVRLTFGQQVQSKESSGKLIELKVSSPSLKGNLLNDSIEQKVAVYLPPSYEISPTKRFPTLYLLHGFSDKIEHWTKGGYRGMSLQLMIDGLIKSGAINEMIVIVPNGRNNYLGSFYTNSTVMGNWEDYIFRDLVSYIDSNYRTMARAESRGIAGHSMGGYGAITLGMKHPDIFSAIYALSPCCLALEGDLSADNPAWSKSLKVSSRDVFKKEPESFDDFFTIVFISLSAAFSPAAQQSPLFVSFPFKEVERRLVPNEPAFSQFRSKMPLYQVEQYRESLLRLRGIYIDYGQNEEFSHIRIASRKFSNELTERGIPHTFEIYKDGDHSSKIKERIETRVLQFFSRTLDFKP